MRVPVISEVHFIFVISIIYSRIPGICQEIKPHQKSKLEIERSLGELWEDIHGWLNQTLVPHLLRSPICSLYLWLLEGGERPQPLSSHLERALFLRPFYLRSWLHDVKGKENLQGILDEPSLPQFFLSWSFIWTSGLFCFVCMHVYCKFIHNHKKLKTTRMFLNKWMDKQAVVGMDRPAVVQMEY